jgi:lysophospholipase L1-like esterase
MMDTMGPDAPALKSLLTKTFPGTQFTIKNYGVGGTNIDYGIERITNAYTYLGNSIPALSSIRPDIVVIESFGYNPFSFDTGAIDKHWLSLAKAVDTVKATIPNVRIVIGSTIAPNWNVFGDGAPGVAFGAEDKKQRVENIKRYLENAVKFAKSQNLPLADAYHPSLDSSGNGKLTYINPGDHIHYSDAGRQLFAQKITSAIVSNRLLE